MTDDSLAGLLRALDLAVFEQLEDGSFATVVAAPAWFPQLSRDPTFPFLGHVLGEAQEFWRAGRDGRRKWGPVAEVDDGGREFHFTVHALVVGGRDFLVFELDTQAEQLREVLQKARDQALELEEARRDRERRHGR